MGNKLFLTAGIILAVIIVLILAVIFYRYNKSTYRDYIREVERIYSAMPSDDAELITPEDIAGLPGPVKKYLEYVGVVGTEKVRNYSVEIDGDFKMSEERDWAHVDVKQMSFIDNPARLFFMEMRFMGLKIFGLHHYESCIATMVIKIMDLFTVADARGPEMNRGETVTVFNDMCILVPSSLIDPRISWKEIDELTVEGTFTNEGISVTAVLYFNETGELINFVSNDRYYWNEDNTYDLIPWMTPVSAYRESNGLKHASYGEAVWLKEDGPFTYARFNLRNVKINPEP